MNTQKEKTLIERLRGEINWLRAHMLYFTLDLKGESPEAWKQRKNDEFQKVISLLEDGKIGICYGDDFYFQRSGGNQKSKYGILTREHLEALLAENVKPETGE